HVAVDVDRALAERLEVCDTAQAAADQPLDLDRPPVWPALGHVALLALARARRQHPVLGRHPAAALAREPARDRLLHRSGADDPRAAAADQRRAGRALHEPRLDRHGPELVRGATAAPFTGHPIPPGST